MTTPITIPQLFTPAASGVGSNPTIPPAAGTWFATLLQMAATVGLPTTSWQPGSPERTILAVAAVALAQEDGIISLQAQGGFLDFAASGTASITNPDGSVTTVPVTPDPSIPSQNPNGSPGWLDALCTSFYNVKRLQATFASGQLAIANTGTGTFTYTQPGTYHVANTNTGVTYANTASLSIPSGVISASGGIVTGVTVGNPTTVITQSAHGLATNSVVYISGVNGISGLSGFFTVNSVPTSTTFTIASLTAGTWTSGGQAYTTTLANFKADVIGTGSNAGSGLVTTTVTANIGVFCTNIAPWSASTWESNTAYVNRTRLSLAGPSPNGPSQAYQYVALSAQSLLSAQIPPVTMTNGAIIQATAFSTPATGVVTTAVASSSPASTTLGQAVTPGCVQLAIVGATNANPIVITSTTPHGLLTGNTATIQGVLGNTAANGTWTITVTGGSTFSLNGSAGNGVYTSNTGTIEGGDLGQVDNLIQQKVVPDDVISITASALAFPITVVATVVVPNAYVSVYPAAAQSALQALLSSFPIGGNLSPITNTYTVPISAIEGALVNAGVTVAGATSYVKQVSPLTVNGSATVDAVYPSNLYQAILPTPTITVVGV